MSPNDRLTRFLRANGLAAAAALALLAASNPPCAFAATDPQAQTDAEDPGVASARKLAETDLAGAIDALKALVAANPQNGAARLELGWLQLRAGDFAAAEKEFRAAGEAGLGFDRVVDGLGIAILGQGDPQRLLKEFDPAPLQGEVRAKVHLFRAQAHLGLQELDVAQTEVANAKAAAPAYFRVALAESVLLMRAGKYAEAEAITDRALADDPENWDAVIQKGELRGLQNDAATALGYFDRALAKSPDDVRARLGRTAALISSGRREEAQGDLDRVLALSPANPTAQYFKALLLAQAGRPDDALALVTSIGGLQYMPPALLLASALSLEKGNIEQARKFADGYAAIVPDSADGAILNGAVALASGEADAAIPELQKAVAAQPANAVARSLLGSALLAAGRSAEAATEFEAAVRSDPSDPNLQVGLARSLFAQGKSDQGESVLSGLVKAGGPGASGAGFLLALAQLRQGDIPAALRSSQALSAREPRSAAARQVEAIVHFAAGDMEAARSSLQAALAIDPAFVPALLGVADLDRAAGRADEAQAGYEAALAKAPNSIDAHAGLAALALAGGDVEGAIGWLGRAGTANPDSPLPSIFAVQALLQARQYDRALAEANGAAGRFPDSADMQDALGVAQLAKGDAPGAIATYGRLLAKDPNQVSARVRLAAAFRAAGRFDEAQTETDAALQAAPGRSDVQRNAVELAFARGDVEKGVRIAEAARSAIADANEGGRLLADAYRAAQRHADAEPLYRNVLDAAPSSPSVLGLIQSLEAQGKRDEAFAVIGRWLDKNPTDSDVRLAKVSNRAAAGALPEATSEAESLLKDRGDDPVLLNNLAWLYDRAGRTADALSVAERAHAAAPQVPEISDTLGWLLVRNGQAERGLPMIREAHAARPGNLEIAYHLAAALKASGDIAGAKEAIGKALASPDAFAERPQAEELKRALEAGN